MCPKRRVPAAGSGGSPMGCSPAALARIGRRGVRRRRRRRGQAPGHRSSAPSCHEVKDDLATTGKDVPQRRQDLDAHGIRLQPSSDRRVSVLPHPSSGDPAPSVLQAVLGCLLPKPVSHDTTFAQPRCSFSDDTCWKPPPHARPHPCNPTPLHIAMPPQGRL